MATITKIVELQLELENPVVKLTEILVEDMQQRLPLYDEEYDVMKGIFTSMEEITCLTLDEAGKVIAVSDGYRFRDAVETLQRYHITREAAEKMLQFCMRRIFGVLKCGTEDLIEAGDESQTKPILESESVE